MAHYEFTHEFQRDILRLILHDESFLLQFRGALDPEWFPDPELRGISAAALRVADASHGAASLGSILEVLPEVLDADSDLDEARDEARRLSDEGLPTDADFVRQKVIQFGATQRVEQVLLAAPSYIEEGRLYEFVDEVRDAAYVQSAANVEVYDYLDTFMDRMKTNRARGENCTGFGLDAIDRHLEGEGLAGGEMCVLCGLPGFGKTEMLVNIGANAIRKGKRVFHALIGDSPNTRVSLRYDCNFAELPLQRVRLDYKAAWERIKAVHEATGGPGRLKVQWWPANTITPQDLEDYLRWLYVRHAWRPDVLIVDYGANMKPPRTHGDNGKRHEQGDIYKDLNALGGKMGIPVYTAIQANRKDGVKVKTLTMDHFAEAFEPARDATLILTVNMTEEERDAGMMRLHCAKYRDAESFWTEMLKIDFTTHTISDPIFDPNDKVGGGDSEAPQEVTVGTVESAPAPSEVTHPGLQPGEGLNEATGEILPPPPPKPNRKVVA